MTTIAVTDKAKATAGSAAHQCRQVSPNPPERSATAKANHASESIVAAAVTVNAVGLMELVSLRNDRINPSGPASPHG